MRPSPLESIHFVAVSFGFIWIVYATKTSALYSSKLYILWHERWDDETSTKWVREREREREILLLYNNEAKVHLTQNNGFNFNYTPSTVYSTNSSIERPNDEPRICNNNSFFFLVTHFGVYFRSIKPSSLSYHTIICVLCVFGMNGSETMQHLLPPLHLLRVNFSHKYPSNATLLLEHRRCDVPCCGCNDTSTKQRANGKCAALCFRMRARQ